MKFVFAQIRNVRQKRVQLVVHGLAGKDPSHMGPESPVARAVRIAFLVRILVMLAMRGDPENGSALKSERSASRQKIFDPLWRLIAAMGEQPVIAHANAETPGNPP